LGAGAAAPGVPAPAPVQLPARAQTTGLLWLNPGADRALGPGESVTLRYRLPAGVAPERLSLRLPPGLRGEVWTLPGGREVAVQLTRMGETVGAGVPQLSGGGRTFDLAPVGAVGQATADGRAGALW
ncbi:VWA domain-containing protein, partial [Deinococcus sp. MIMF12]|nr:VWA domain-containing protein [Deinococcus rhizophilus]